MSQTDSNKTSPLIKVTPIDLAHIDACKSLDSVAFNGFWSHQQWHNELSNPEIICFGIMDSSNLLALVTGQVVVDELQLSTLAVHPEFRRKGFGRLLLLTLLVEARFKGAIKATLEVSSENIAARALYKSLGFETIGSRNGYYRNGSDALIQLCTLKDERKLLDQISVSVDYRHDHIKK